MSQFETVDRRSIVKLSNETVTDGESSDEDLTATSTRRNSHLAAKTIITELSRELEASRHRELEARA